MKISEKLFRKKIENIKKSLIKKGRSESAARTIIHAIQYLCDEGFINMEYDTRAQLADYSQSYISPEQSVMIIGELFGNTTANFEIYKNDTIEKRDFNHNKLLITKCHPRRPFSEVDAELTKAEASATKSVRTK